MNLFFGGSPGIGRLFGPSMGVEASWLLPAALIGLLAGLWFTRRTARTAPVRAGLLLWGGWLLVTGVVFSFMGGTVHPYYTVELAPAIAAVVGISVCELWRRRENLTPRIVMAVMAAVTGVWGLRLAGPDAGLGAVAAVGDSGRLDRGGLGHCRRRAQTRQAHRGGDHRRGAVGAGRAGRVRALQRHSPARRPGNDVRSASPRPVAPAAASPAAPAGGPVAQPDNPALDRLVQSAGNRWAAASVGSFTVSSLELKTGASLMAIGGFTGADNSPTLAQFKQYVSGGQVGYFIPGDKRGPHGDSSGSGAQITQWVQQNFTPIQVGGTTVYDLSQSR